MKRFKKFIASALAASLSLTTFVGASSAASPSDKYADIFKLIEEDDDGFVDVTIWLNDPDFSSLDKMITDNMKQRGFSYSDIKSVLETDDEFCDDELLDESTDIDNKIIDTYLAANQSVREKLLTKHNSDFCNKYITNENILFSGKNIPIVVCKLDKNTLLKMSYSKDISFMEEYDYTEVTNDDISISQLRSIVLGATFGNQGNGVKIGQIESCVPDLSLCDSFSGCVITYLNENPDSPAAGNVEHATAVANILIGENGLAHNAELVSYALQGENASFYKGIDELVGESVNIINMSAGYYGTRQGTYDSYAKLVDYVVKNNNICFVKSAGNKNTSSGNTQISSPGMAYNAITVGNCDSTFSTISPSSLYTHSSGIAEKPDVVAPGMQIATEVTGYNTKSGTSFSSPAVAGAIAALMSHRSAYKTKPWLVKGGLAVGAKQGTYSGTTFFSNGGQTKEAGAGLINAHNSLYSHYVTMNNVQSTTRTYTSTYDCPTGSKVRVAVTWYADAVNNGSIVSPSISTVNVNQYTITVKQGNTVLDTVQNSSSMKNNMLIMEVTAANDSNLTFEVTRLSGTVTDSVTISYTID